MTLKSLAPSADNTGMRTHRFVAATSTFLVAVTFSATAAWGVLAHDGPAPVHHDKDWAVIVPNDDGAAVAVR